MLIEDEHGQMNLIVPPPVYERYRAVVRGEPLLLARGRFERYERNRNVVVEEVESLAPLARRAAGDEDVSRRAPGGPSLRAALNRPEIGAESAQFPAGGAAIVEGGFAGGGSPPLPTRPRLNTRARGRELRKLPPA